MSLNRAEWSKRLDFPVLISNLAAKMRVSWFFGVDNRCFIVAYIPRSTTQELYRNVEGGQGIDSQQVAAK